MNFLALLYQWNIAAETEPNIIQIPLKASHNRTTLEMGKFGDALEIFLLSIPQEKLEWFPDHTCTVHKDLNFRLDMQTVGGPHILYVSENF